MDICTDQTINFPLTGVSDMVKETWKYAAAEICDMLNRVKDHAGDTKALETQINKMVASMNQQSDVINQLNKRIKELEEVYRRKECHY